VTLSEIVDAEGIDKVIVAGHDWGSFLAKRFYLFHPEHAVSIILLNVAYNPPGPPFDLEVLLQMTEKQLGRALFAYWQPSHRPRWPRDLAGARGESMDGIAGSR
jgi:pimeloyl-ACP methyl ester carboxylesterase